MLDIIAYYISSITYDQWMNLSAGAGMSIYLFSIWILLRGRCKPGSWTNRCARLAGLVLLFLPLLTRWYMSSSLIITCGVCMVIFAAYKIIRRPR